MKKIYIDYLNNELIININKGFDNQFEEKIKRTFKNINPIFEKNNIFFKLKKNNYQEINNIFDYFKRYTEENNFNFIVSDKLNEYFYNIENKKNNRKRILKSLNEIKDSVDFNNDEYQKFKDEILNLLKLSPYELQFKSIYHHFLLESACNFSIPGIGKTLIGLSYFLYLKSKDKIKKLIVICPKNSFISWKDESNKFIKKFKEFKINVCNNWPLKYKENNVLLGNDVDIILINYEKFQKKSHIFNSLKKYLENNDVLFILDEAHRIKNGESKTSKNIFNLILNENYKLIFTGTPMPNSFQDLKVYFDLIKKPYEKSIINENINLKNLDNKNLKKVKYVLKDIEKYYFRITKKQLKIKPAQIEKCNDIHWTSLQEELYFSLKKNIYSIFDKWKVNPFKFERLIRSKIMRLVQISIDPRLINEKYLWDIKDFQESIVNKKEDKNFEIEEDEWYENYQKNKKKYEQNFNEKLPRYKYCKEIIKKIFNDKSNKKVIVWSCFKFTIKELKKELENDFQTKIIFGDTKQFEREEIIHDFQSKDGKIQVLIANPATIAESVSLHQQCKNSIYFDMTFNALYYLQSKDRIHRYSNDSHIKIVKHHLIYRNSNVNNIEKYIWNKIFEKENRMLKTLENEQVLESISKDYSEESDGKTIIDDILSDFKNDKNII